MSKTFWVIELKAALLQKMNSTKLTSVIHLQVHTIPHSSTLQASIVEQEEPDLAKEERRQFSTAV